MLDAMGFSPFCSFGVKFAGCLSGTLSPDATGDYRVAGWYNGREYWVDSTDTYYIWWDPEGPVWFITTVLGVEGNDNWSRSFDSPYGEYLPEGTYTGNATFAEGVCP